MHIYLIIIFRKMIKNKKKETATRSQLRFKSDCHEVCTEKVNKIPISHNNDKRIQTYDRITTYPYGTSAFKILESRMLIEKKKNDII